MSATTILVAFMFLVAALLCLATAAEQLSARHTWLGLGLFAATVSAAVLLVGCAPWR
jgi:hypothetical protein